MRQKLLRCIFIIIALFSNKAVADLTKTPSEEKKLLIESIREKCIELRFIKIGTDDYEISKCRVAEFGTIGIVDNKTYYYALYALHPNWDKEYNDELRSNAAMLVFVGEGSSREVKLYLERADSEIGMIWYEKPEIIQNAFGTLLYLPIALSGTGVGNVSEYYIWDKRAKEWQLLGSEAWQEEFRLKVPTNLHIAKGIWPDLKTMTADIGLYKKDDANCCPTGGRAYVKLKIADKRRFEIKSVTFDFRNPEDRKSDKTIPLNPDKPN
jgi:hypothetical protein